MIYKDRTLLVPVLVMSHDHVSLCAVCCLLVPGLDHFGGIGPLLATATAAFFAAMTRPQRVDRAAEPVSFHARDPYQLNRSSRSESSKDDSVSRVPAV